MTLNNEKAEEMVADRHIPSLNTMGFLPHGF